MIKRRFTDMVADRSTGQKLSVLLGGLFNRSKNRWLDLKEDFAAKGDGSSDDTVLIQSALNIARDKGSVKLYLPEGTYAIYDYLRLYKNTIIEMHPKAVIKRAGIVNKVFMNGESGNTTYSTVYNGEGNIHIKGGTIDMNRDSLTFNTTGSISAGNNKLTVASAAGMTSGMYITVKGAGAAGADFYATISSIAGNVLTFLNSDGTALNASTTVSSAQCTAIKTISAFDLSHGENITFEGLTVTNGHSGHYFQLTGVKSIRFRNCKFTNQLHAYLGSYMFEIIQMEATTSTSFPSFGSWDSTPTKDVVIENCLFDNTIRGIGNHSDAMYGTSNIIYCDGLRVRNCTFTNAADIPITLTGFKNFVVSDSTVDTTGSHGIDAYNSDNGIIRNITVRNTQKAGLNTTSLNFTKIVGNTFENTSAHPTNTYSCIRLTDSSNLTIYDNTAQDATPRYAYPILGSGTWSNNKQFNNNMKPGKSGSFQGVGDFIWVSVGDSITNGGNLDSNGISQGYYQDTALTYLPQVNKHYKRGYGGYQFGKMTTGSYTANSILDKTAEIETGDLYTVLLGTNDFSHAVPIGSTADAAGTTNSMWGGMKQLLVDLTNKNMNCTVVIITPPKRGTGTGSTLAWNDTNSLGLKMDDYVAAIKAFANQYALPIIDLYNIAGISARNYSTFLYDGLHPNLAGNPRIGKIIGKHLTSNVI